MSTVLLASSSSCRLRQIQVHTVLVVEFREKDKHGSFETNEDEGVPTESHKHNTSYTRGSQKVWKKR
jgi:hypothetical protein